MNGNDVETLFRAATLALQENRLRDAEAAYRALLSGTPTHPGALHGLGLLAARTGHVADAIGLLQQAMALHPDWAECCNQLGLLLLQSGDIPAAIAAFTRVVELEPEFPDAHNSLGAALQKQGNIDQAIASYKRALAARPDHLPALTHLASAFRIKRQTADAVQCLQRAAALRPDVAEIHYNLGIELKELDQLDAAIAAYRRALALRNDLVEAHLNLGNALLQTGDIDAGIAELKIAATTPSNDRPASPVVLDARWTHACAVLLRGDYATGWGLYEVRHERAQALIEPRFRDRLWDGSDLRGKRILLFCEQGLGDTIQFVRYAPLLKERGAEVYLLCKPELRELLTGQLGISRFVSEAEDLPAFDVCCPLMSLPHRLRLADNQIPNSVPYITAAPALAAHWSERLKRAKGLRIGLRWAANPAYVNDRYRSTTLATFAPLAAMENVSYFSLQTDLAASQSKDLQAELQLHQYPADFTLAETAALISNLDLVISVDTGFAHLCGALGQPVWILTSHLPDWRWHLNRTDSPWYPTARLFRQPTRGDWGPVISEIVRELKQLLTVCGA